LLVITVQKLIFKHLRIPSFRESIRRMATVMDLLYLGLLGAIRVWRMFTHVLFLILLKPIKAEITRRMKLAGITINGSEPHDIQVHNEMYYHRMINEGTMGTGESYMEGWWDCKRLDVYFTKAIRFGLSKQLLLPTEKLIHYLQFHVFNLQTAARSWEVAEKHYNL
ncbi:unnamed protein product, partial [Allacma fusca]